MPELEVFNGETKRDAHTINNHVHALGNAQQDASEPTAERVPLLVAVSSGHGCSNAQCSTASNTDGFVSISIANGADVEHQVVSNNQATDQHNKLAHTGRFQTTFFLLCKGRRSFWESGTATMVVAALIMATGALAVALIDSRVPVFEIVMIRSAASLMLTMSFVKAKKWTSYLGTRHLWPVLAMRGFVGAASMTLYYEAIDRMPLADAITIMYSNPVLVALLAWALRREVLSLRGCVGIAVTLLGVVVVAQPPFLFGGHEWSPTRLAGFVMGVLAAVTAAVAFFAITCIPKSEPALVVSLWFHTAAIATAIVPLIVGYPDKVMLPGAFDSGMLCIIIFASFFGQMLLNHGFQIQSAAKGSSINCTQVLYAHIYGITLLNEQETVWGILGSLLIASGVVTVNGAKIENCDKPQAPYQHPSLLPMFQYKQASMAEGNADRPAQKPECLAPADPNSSGESGSRRGNIFQAALSWLRSGVQHAGGRLTQQPSPFQQLQLTGLASCTSADGASPVAVHSSAASSGCDGQLLGPSLQQQEGEGPGDGQLYAAEGGAALVQGKRRTRGRPGGPPLERDREQSWIGEWAFRKETDSERLAPAMARYHQLLERDRE